MKFVSVYIIVVICAISMAIGTLDPLTFEFAAYLLQRGVNPTQVYYVKEMAYFLIDTEQYDEVKRLNQLSSTILPIAGERKGVDAVRALASMDCVYSLRYLAEYSCLDGVKEVLEGFENCSPQKKVILNWTYRIEEFLPYLPDPKTDTERRLCAHIIRLAVMLHRRLNKDFSLKSSLISTATILSMRPEKFLVIAFITEALQQNFNTRSTLQRDFDAIINRRN